MDLTIYHNPRCRKSRETLQLIRDNGIEPKIIEYLKDTPSEDGMKKLLAKLNKGPQDILRKNEAVFKQKFKGLEFNDDEWVKVMTEEPKLIERPIVVKGNRAILGRPPENVLDLIEE